MTRGRLAIVGASSLGQQIAGHSAVSGGFEIVGFFDDFAPLAECIIGRTTEMNSMFAKGAFDCLAIGVGYKAMDFRHSILERVVGRVPLADIRHPSVFADPTADIGEGCVMLANVVVDQRVRVGRNVFMSIAASVSHDSTIGDSAYLSPKSTVCGNCRIGERVFLGAGCVVRDGISISDGVVIGAGTVVVKDIVQSGVYAGNPARRIESKPCM